MTPPSKARSIAAAADNLLAAIVAVGTSPIGELAATAGPETTAPWAAMWEAAGRLDLFLELYGHPRRDLGSLTAGTTLVEAITRVAQLENCRHCRGGGLDTNAKACGACDGSGTDEVWRAGRAARVEGQARAANPHRLSPDMDRWAAGWIDAHRNIGSVRA
jgi:hypothetical protein